MVEERAKVGVGSKVKLKSPAHKDHDPATIVMLTRDRQKRVSTVIVSCGCGNRVGLAPKRIVPVKSRRNGKS